MTGKLADLIEKGFKEGRASGLSIRDCAVLIAEVVMKKLTDDDPPAPVDVVQVQSVVSAASGDPLVQCRVGGERWQWEPDEARAHARAVFEVAEAAVQDAAAFRWMTLSMGLDPEPAFAAILDLRRFRGDVDKEDWGPDGATKG